MRRSPQVLDGTAAASSRVSEVAGVAAGEKKKEMGVEPAGACLLLLDVPRRALAAGERAVRGEHGDCRSLSGREERGDVMHSCCRSCDSPATVMRRLCSKLASSREASRSIPGC